MLPSQRTRRTLQFPNRDHQRTFTHYLETRCRIHTRQRFSSGQGRLARLRPQPTWVQTGGTREYRFPGEIATSACSPQGCVGPQ